MKPTRLRNRGVDIVWIIWDVSQECVTSKREFAVAIEYTQGICVV